LIKLFRRKNPSRGGAPATGEAALPPSSLKRRKTDNSVINNEKYNLCGWREEKEENNRQNQEEAVKIHFYMRVAPTTLL
jgi:hypothetical protein